MCCVVSPCHKVIVFVWRNVEIFVSNWKAVRASVQRELNVPTKPETPIRASKLRFCNIIGFYFKFLYRRKEFLLNGFAHLLARRLILILSPRMSGYLLFFIFFFLNILFWWFLFVIFFAPYNLMQVTSANPVRIYPRIR